MSARTTLTSRQDLETYIRHFNAKEYDRQIAYYAPDVRYKVGTLTIDGPEQIKAFYQDFHRYSDEYVNLREFAMTGDVIAAAMETRFEPFRDYRKNGLEFRAGERRDIVTLAFYRLKQGQIHRIRMARYGGPAEDFG